MEVKEDPVLTRVKDVIKNGKKAIGQQEFIDLLYGDSLSTAKLIKAFCYDCRAWYADGIGDCKDKKCPLYSKMPYATIPPEYARIRTRNSNTIRNEHYPVENRLMTKTSILNRKRDHGNLWLGRDLEKKMRKKKYPQETTQKEITMKERSIAIFDTAVREYEREKKEKKKYEDNKHK